MPLADTALLARATRRTTVVRRGLGLVLAGALAAGLVLLRNDGRASAAAGAPKHTVIVLDLSGSIAGPAYGRIGSLFESLAATAGNGSRVGLVVFSDVAQEALPPDTKPTELLAYARYFRPKRPQPSSLYGPAEQFGVTYPDNPWESGFSSGTRISSGLALARRVVARDHVGSARVLLVSDLFDAGDDQRRLKSELLAYTRSPGIELRVLPVEPHSQATFRTFTRYLGERHVALAPAPMQRHVAAGSGTSVPVAFVAVVAALALALGANELLAPRFRWREPQR